MTLQKYSDSLLDFTRNNLSNKPFDFDEVEKLFDADFKNFCTVNTHLLYCAFNSDNNTQIVVPDKYFKEDLLNPILLSVSVFKYFQNISLQKDNSFSDTVIARGDVYILNNRFCEVTRILEDKVHFEYLNKKKVERESISRIVKAKSELFQSLKLRSKSDFSYTNTSGKVIDAYFDFYKKMIPVGFSRLTRFHKKTVIISAASILNSDHKRILPFRYNGEKSDIVPVEPLIEVFNTYAQARIFLKENRGVVDEVIVAGYKKYQHDFGQMLNDQNRGIFSKLIIIGSKKVNDRSFKYWQWTNKEIKLLSEKEREQKSISAQNISNSSIIELRDKLSDFCNKTTTIGIPEGDIQSINNFFLSLFSQQLTSNSKGNLKAYIGDLFDCQDNDFDYALSCLEVSDQRRYKSEYMSILNDCLDTFKSGKEQAIINLKQIDKFYKIVVPKRQKQEVEELVESCGHKKHQVLSSKNLEDVLTKTEPEQVSKTVFIVPHINFKYNNPLWYFHLYSKSREYGDVKILCYEGLDEERLKMFETLYKKQEDYRLYHPDRKLFVDIVLPERVEIENAEEEEILDILNTVDSDNKGAKDTFEKINKYFKKKFKAEIGFSTSYEFGKKTTTPVKNPFLKAEKRGINDRFLMKTSDVELELRGSKKFVVKKGHHFQNRIVADLKSGDKIIYDWKLELKPILKVVKNDKNLKAEVRELEQAGKLWQGWLRVLLSIYEYKYKGNAAKELYKSLKLDVTISTMNTWLTTKDYFLFPKRNTDLESIIDLKRRKTPDTSKVAFEEDVKKLKKGSTTLLFRLKDELNRWICQDDSCEILKNLPEKEVKKLLLKKQIVTVEKIEKI